MLAFVRELSGRILRHFDGGFWWLYTTQYSTLRHTHPVPYEYKISALARAVEPRLQENKLKLSASAALRRIMVAYIAIHVRPLTCCFEN